MNETVKSLVYAAIIALLIRCFLYEPFSIPSSSMVPTLEVGDFLFVSKHSYGYSSKSSFFGLPVIDGRTSDRRPERGDVVVFKLPSNPSIDYIKRVVGLPGERIQMIRGRLFINGQLVERKQLGTVELNKTPGEEPGVMQPVILYSELLPNGLTHIIAEESDNARYDNTQEFIVPSDHYFVMGDNRDNSQDSRAVGGAGYVPAENLVGRADMIFFSLEAGTSFLEFWRWPFDIRFSRMFDLIK